MPLRLGVLCSGRGSNFERIVQACKSGEIPDAEVVCCVLDRPAGAQEIAKKYGIDCMTLEPKNFPDRLAWMRQIADELKKRKTGLVVLAGFLRKIEKPVLEAFPKKILNIHPALLPAFGGAGMYGIKVHEAVLASKVQESGVSIHLVDDEYDHGETIYQEKVPVMDGDTPEALQKRVLEAEHRAYPKAIAEYIRTLRP